MRTLAFRGGIALAIAVFVSPAWTQVPAASVASDPLRIVVVGASVSAGFIDPAPRADGERNSTVRLARALTPLWGDGRVEWRDQSDLLVFMDPSTSGSRQIDRAIQAAPALVLAVDFPFWFGYGGFGGSKVRLARQDELFALLDKLLAAKPVPVLLGDYPDMRGADPRMLPPSAVPSVEDLATLNRRLREWAARHPSVTLFALSDFVTAARGDGVQVRFGGDEVRLPSTLLMQSDRLHASRAGMAVLAHRLAQALHEALPAEHPLRPEVAAFDAYAEHTGATDEIEDALDAGPSTVVPPEKGARGKRGTESSAAVSVVPPPPKRS